MNIISDFNMNPSIMIFIISFILFLGITTNATAGKELKIDNQYRTELIDTVITKIKEVYILPDIGDKLCDHIKKKLADGQYDKFKDHNSFINELAKDFSDISGDKHLRIFPLSPETCAKFKTNQEAYDYYHTYYLSDYSECHGVKEVRVLDGNIGYFKLDEFIDVGTVYNKIIAAMTLLRDCEAFIIDLTNNGGGDGNTVALLASYFFKERTRLNDAYYRKADSTEQFWTVTVPNPGNIYEKDLYVMIGNGTFSAAEDFAYAMQALKRATLIGEKTRGGGHPIEMFFFVKFCMSLDIPNAYSYNKITGSNWEKVGVIPEIEVPLEGVYDFTYKKALNDLKAKSNDEKIRAKTDWALEALKYKDNEVNLSEEEMNRYTGNYGKSNIILEDRALYYQRLDGSKFKLKPMTELLFSMIDRNDSRIKFYKDDSGKITGFDFLFYEGGKSEFKRTD